MANDSTTGGFLSPIPNSAPVWHDVAAGWSRGLWQDVPPLAGRCLYRFLHAVIAGITGLSGNLIFPRWQPEPPNLPDCDWAAFGIMRRVTLGYPYIGHDPVAEVDRMQRQEMLDCLTSFYGPNADAYSAALREGLTLPQNNEPFIYTGFGLASSGDIIVLPSLVKQRWLQRFDHSFSLYREINRVYPVKSIESFLLRIQTDSNLILTYRPT